MIHQTLQLFQLPFLWVFDKRGNVWPSATLNVQTRTHPQHKHAKQQGYFTENISGARALLRDLMTANSNDSRPLPPILVSSSEGALRPDRETICLAISISRLCTLCSDNNITSNYKLLSEVVNRLNAIGGLIPADLQRWEVHNE